MTVNTRTWTYSASAPPCIIELKHFLNSGNFIILCDGKALLVDFDVFNSRTFSFFINDEFCRIELIKNTDNQFSYFFHIDKNIDTPRNQDRKKQDKKNRLYGYLAVAASITSVYIFYLFVAQYIARKKEQDLLNNGVVAIAKMQVIDHIVTGQPYGECARCNLIAHYQLGTTPLFMHLELPKNKLNQVIAPNGMPIQNGDEFHIKFSAKDVWNYRILYQSPTPYQLEQYRNRTLLKYQEANPNLPPDYYACSLDAAYRAVNLAAYPHFYFQNTPRQQNKQYNTNTFKKFIQSPQYLQQLNASCH